MAKTVFSDGNAGLGQKGTKVTAAFLTAINNHIHDGADIDGHVQKITTPELSAEVLALFLPVSTVLYVSQQTAPTGFLKCNGAAISRTTYSALFAAIGTVFGVGNGATTFNLPDLRGEFIRGWDDARGIDAGRAFGSWQADELRSHQHFVYREGGGEGGAMADAATSTNYPTATTFTGGTETRPRNCALLAIIKY